MTSANAPTSPRISLRRVQPADVPLLYANECDPVGNRLAGVKPRSEEAFRAVWDRLFQDATIVARVILDHDAVVGAISCFQKEGIDYVGYWVSRSHWGRGVASQALAIFLSELPRRPLRASVAMHNPASMRVLEKCGFRRTVTFLGEETERYVAGEVVEFVLDGQGPAELASGGA